LYDVFLMVKASLKNDVSLGNGVPDRFFMTLQ
jgi:hypothetical protein